MSSTQPKSLLIGASGQIGGQMLYLLGPDRCLVTSRKPGSDAVLQLDLASIPTKADAECILGRHALDAIYCIAGMTNVEGCDGVPEQAYLTNCRGPEMLARVASERKIPFVYFSTEYIFDGNDGPYVEEATAHIGQPAADRPFFGHLTIARGSRGTDFRAIPHLLSALSGSWPVTSLSLVHSQLSAAGAHYRDLRAFPLGAPRAPSGPS